MPVLDVMHGQVVRAVRGERHAYRPIVSPLAAGCEPVTVARALLGAAPGRPATLYLADLDAIQGGPVQAGVIAALLAALPGVELWIDAGFAGPQAVRRLAAALPDGRRGWRPVYGSESIADAAALEACAADWAADPGAILSLDHRGAALDPSGCRWQPHRWPATLIVMTLDRVGSGGGPDLATFAALRHRAPGKRWFGAGGVRGAADLAAAAAAGAAGWLVASALHEGSLGVDAAGGGSIRHQGANG